MQYFSNTCLLIIFVFNPALCRRQCFSIFPKPHSLAPHTLNCINCILLFVIQCLDLSILHLYHRIILVNSWFLIHDMQQTNSHMDTHTSYPLLSAQKFPAQSTPPISGLSLLLPSIQLHEPHIPPSWVLLRWSVSLGHYYLAVCPSVWAAAAHFWEGAQRAFIVGLLQGTI